MIMKPRSHSLDNKSLQYIYCPISQKNKDNQAIKFGQCIEYNMRNIFIKKSYTKSRTSFPDPFIKNQN